jgi:hypothetical protein
VGWAFDKYGDHGSHVSGVVRDHFPPEIKNELRELASAIAKQLDAAYAARPKGVRKTTIRMIGSAVAKHVGYGSYGV